MNYHPDLFDLLVALAVVLLVTFICVVGYVGSESGRHTPTFTIVTPE